MVVEIYSKSVRLNESAATSPIAGKAAIFQKPEVTQQVAARILGVWESEVQARKSVPNAEGAEYVVQRCEVNRSLLAPVLLAEERSPIENRCIMCGGLWPTSFCHKCEVERNAIMREREAGIIAEQVPASA